MNESNPIEIRFKPVVDHISADEVSLLESILPEIIRTMMQEQEENEAV